MVPLSVPLSPLLGAPVQAVPWYRSRNGRIGLVVGATALVVGGGLTALLLARGGGGGGARGKIVEAVALVGASQAKVSAAVAPDGSAQQTLTLLRDASTELASTLDGATTQIRQAAPAATDAGLVNAALETHRKYAAALVKVGIQPLSANVAQLEQAETLRSQALTSYAALRQRVPIPDVSLTASLAPLSAKIRAVQKADLQVKTFTSRMNQLLQASSQGRGEISSVIARTEACNLPPDQASTQISSVADNRQSVLNQIAGITPPTPAMQRVLDTLQEALTHSREADRQYAQWVLNQTSWYYAPPVGCPSGRMPRDEFHARASSESAAATAAKRRFVDLYNPLAQRYGLPTWTESRI